jgi:hypothetical protein
VVDGWLEPSRLHDRQLGLLRADWLNQDKRGSGDDTANM